MTNFYEVEVPRLIKLTQPLKTLGMGEILTSGEIFKAWNEGDIFPDAILSRANNIRQVAYYLANPEIVPPVISSLSNIKTNDLCKLAASDLLNQSHITCSVFDEAKSFLGELKPTTNKVVPVDSHEVLWFQINDEKWQDLEYVLNWIDTKNSFSDAYNNSPKEWWQERDFLQKLFNLNSKHLVSLEKMNSHDYYSMAVLDVVEHDIESIYEWVVLFEKNKKSSSFVKDLTQAKIEELNNTLYNRYYNNPENALKLIQSDYGQFWYPRLTDELKTHHQLLDYIYSQPRDKSKFNPLKVFPQTYWEKPENRDMFWSRYQGHIHHTDLENNIELIRDFFKSRASLIEKIEKITNPDVILLYRYLPKDVRLDNDIADLFMKKSVFSYVYLPLELQTQEKYFAPYLDSHFNIERVPEKILYSQTNRTYIEKIITKNPDLLSGAPKAWREDVDLVLLAAHRLPQLKNMLQSFWKKLSESYEKCEYALSKNIQNYEYLTLEMKCNHNLAHMYLQADTIEDKDIGHHIPKKMWLSQDFCILAMSYASDYAKKVSEPFWFRSDFIKKLTSHIEVDVSASVFLYAPLAVKDFIKNYPKPKDQTWPEYTEKMLLKDRLTLKLEQYESQEKSSSTLPNLPNNISNIKKQKI